MYYYEMKSGIIEQVEDHVVHGHGDPDEYFQKRFYKRWWHESDNDDAAD